MVRRKEYDRQDVLEKAVFLFWQKGYKASSMSDIVHATGLNTASMYKEFGDKDGLFEAALEFYQLNIMSRRIQILDEEPNIKGVEAVLESVVNGASSEEYKGCLMMNHLAQIHTISPQAARQVNDFCTRMENLLEIALHNAQISGDIPTNKDPAILASFVMCSIHGLVLYGRHPNKNEEIRKLYEVLLSTLKK